MEIRSQPVVKESTALLSEIERLGVGIPLTKNKALHYRGFGASQNTMVYKSTVHNAELQNILEIKGNEGGDGPDSEEDSNTTKVGV